MNVVVVLHNNGVAMVTNDMSKVNAFLKKLVGNDAIVVEDDGEDVTLDSIAELYEYAEAMGDCGESVICKFGCAMGDDSCTLAITLREVE